jgi:hypothetical protein
MAAACVTLLNKLGPPTTWLKPADCVFAITRSVLLATFSPDSIPPNRLRDGTRCDFEGALFTRDGALAFGGLCLHFALESIGFHFVNILLGFP